MILHTAEWTRPYLLCLSCWGIITQWTDSVVSSKGWRSPGLEGWEMPINPCVLSLTPTDFPMWLSPGLPSHWHVFFPLPPPRHSNELWHLQCQAEKPSQREAAPGLRWAAQHMVSTPKAAKKQQQLAVNFTHGSHQDQFLPISNISIMEGKNL